MAKQNPTISLVLQVNTELVNPRREANEAASPLMDERNIAKDVKIHEHEKDSVEGHFGSKSPFKQRFVSVAARMKRKSGCEESRKRKRRSGTSLLCLSRVGIPQIVLRVLHQTNHLK